VAEKLPLPPGIQAKLGQEQLFSQLNPYQREEKMWYYIDGEGKPQGPFTSIEMDEWNTEGYFYPSLMIAYEHIETMQDFIPLMIYQ